MAHKQHLMMAILFFISLLVLDVLGNPQLNLMRNEEVQDSLCVVADDMICPRDDITFWLYTQTTQENPTKLNVDTLDVAPWVDGPLKFLVHGYSVDKDTAINAVLRPAYFAHGDYNIISVDWSTLCRDGCYVQSVQNVPTVAKCVADFFVAVVKAHQFSQVHLLGHSMGAHVASWASAQIPDLPRLTKFDVAHPLFNSQNSRNGTAGFIDVYHSNCGLKGQRRASGDVDVYFNNRAFQPGCNCDTSCSHLRAVEYYAESIGRTPPLKAFPCHSWSNYVDDKCRQPMDQDLVVVGEDADTTVRGRYLAFTNDQPPYLLDDNVYTDKTSFKSFKTKLAGECTLLYDYKQLVGAVTNLF